MKLALMLGAMAAGRRAGGPRELLSQGTKLLETSPELSRLVGEVRGRLLEAGKGAAVAVATRQVESLTDRVGKRVESLAGAGAPPRGKADEEPEPERDRYSEDEYAQDEYEQDSGSGAEPEEEPAEEPAAAPPPRRTRAPAKTTAARAGKNPSASAAVRRSASSAGKAGGRKPARAGRTQRSNGDG